VLHFHKLDQQRKVHKENEVSRPTKYNKIRESTMSFDNAHKKIHNIDSDGCRQLENWEKIFGPPQPKNKNRAFDTRKEYNHPRGGYMSRGRARGRNQDRPLYCMYHERDTDHRTRDCPIFLESKKKMTQNQNQPPNPPPAKEVNHTSHSQQPSQSSSSYHPLYQHSNSRSEYQPNYHKYPSPYYQPYNYVSTTNQSHLTQPSITYLLPPLQIIYPTTNT
jgi:hypothetical protein